MTTLTIRDLSDRLERAQGEAERLRGELAALKEWYDAPTSRRLALGAAAEASIATNVRYALIMARRDVSPGYRERLTAAMEARDAAVQAYRALCDAEAKRVEGEVSNATEGN